MTSEGVHPVDLEPGLVGYRTYATRRTRGRLDAAMLVSVMVCLLTLIPSRYIVPGLSDVGRPALLAAVLLFCWWIATHLNHRLVMTGPQPVRWAAFGFLLSMLISYAIGFHRGLTGMESSAADRTMIGTAAFLGVILLVADGVANWDRVVLILRVFVGCAVVMAVIGLIQATLPINPVEYIVIPGLESQGGLIPFEQRGGGVRVPSTTTHYLELAATLALALPFAIHFAIFAGDGKSRRRYIVAAMIIFTGICVTISRTGLLSAAILILMLIPLWPWRLRYNIAALIATMLGLLTAVQPSMARTFYDMFAGASEDPSVTARTDRYELVGYYFNQRPWFGRGTGTWVPPMYPYLDNQWFGLALSNGLFGCLMLALLHITATVLAALGLRRSTKPADRHLCLILIAIQVVAIVAAATFDSLAFTTYSTMLAVTIGLCGTVWRFTHPKRTVRTSMPQTVG